ncbi:MAG: hypothetical protein LC644_09050 [Pseudonocardia sp.]|nr:hypothetical protein [Pseudonocardia sp.]
MVGCAQRVGADHDTVCALRAMPPVSYSTSPRCCNQSR